MPRVWSHTGSGVLTVHSHCAQTDPEGQPHSSQSRQGKAKEQVTGRAGAQVPLDAAEAYFTAAPAPSAPLPGPPAAAVPAEMLLHGRLTPRPQQAWTPWRGVPQLTSVSSQALTCAPEAAS